MARDDTVAGLLDKADHSSDPAERQALYGQAIHRITEQAYWLPVLAYPQIVAFNKALDFTPSDDEVPRFYNASWKR
jgi:peptide/nickel transport system substrate-binding protein